LSTKWFGTLNCLPSKCKRIERESKRIVKSVIFNFPTYTVSLRASYEPLRIIVDIFSQSLIRSQLLLNFIWKGTSMHICARKFKVCKNWPRKYCKDKYFEVCAIKIHFNAKSACIIAIYRAPSGNFDLFISKLDTILRKLYTVSTEYIICGDINIDYLVDNDKKSQLEALLKTCNLTSVVNFPTRTQKHSGTAFDNIFIDISKMRNYSVSNNQWVVGPWCSVHNITFFQFATTPQKMYVN